LIFTYHTHIDTPFTSCHTVHTSSLSQELKKKELDELDAIFSELGISVEEQAKRDAEAEKKRKKKEKKKEAAAANGSSGEQQQQQPAADAPPADAEAAEQEEEPGETVDPAVVSGRGAGSRGW
jgi:hypothetical protein